MFQACIRETSRYHRRCFFTVYRGLTRNIGASAQWIPRLTNEPIGVVLSNNAVHDRLGGVRRYSAESPQPVPLARLGAEPFLDGSSANYVEQMYEQFQQDPNSVHASWRAFFANVQHGVLPGDGAYVAPPGGHGGSGQPGSGAAQPHSLAQQYTAGLAGTPLSVANSIVDSMRAIILIRAFAISGHQLARTDPLGLRPLEEPNNLKITSYGWTEADLDREIFIGEGVLKGFGSDSRPVKTLREIVDLCKRAYCGHMGVEFMHIHDRSVGDWLRARLETLSPYQFTREEKQVIWDRVAWTELFEKFVGRKFQDKRFGLDGGEAFVPGLKALIDRAAMHGVENVNMGMAHRGRLNVLANVVRKPLELIFSEFRGILTQDAEWGSSGDVKYHLGESRDRPTLTPGKHVHLVLLPNPSHLEAVNPVVEGKTRAKQLYSNDPLGQRSLSVLIHGDASFAGQGVVYESLELNTHPEFSTRGTIHVIINNQIGFTTDPPKSLQGTYCSDVAKTVGAPIFHVNGDYPEEVVHAFQLAADYRAKFSGDVVIDVVCYRRFGHNEIDQPKFTQPLMYDVIERHPSVLQRYTEQLVKEGVFTAEESVEKQDKIQAIMTEHFNAAAGSDDSSVKATLAAHRAGKRHNKTVLPPPSARDSPAVGWKQFLKPNQTAPFYPTAIDPAMAQKIGEAITTLPANFKAHRNISSQLKAKRKMFETGEGIDWATGEALAFGSLSLDHVVIRLTGQDVERGTFSHRHAVLHDQNTGETFMPLKHIAPGQAPVTMQNSVLSEFAALGFEYGFAMESPMSLVLWEAQFGDFVNGAQIMLDQFIASAEQKWQRQCGIVLLLPHGYQGAGPEHSSCRPERFLLAADCDPFNPVEHGREIQACNWQVVNCTTPANYFHVLRRQMKRDFRKPLIVIAPKALLRHRDAVSPLSEFITSETEDHRFRSVIDDGLDRAAVAAGLSVAPSLESPAARQLDELRETAVDSVRKVLMCTGQVYYDLLAKWRQLGEPADTVLIRIEQLAPFPTVEIRQAVVNRYPNAHLHWVQEEAFNMGYYHHVFMHVMGILGNNLTARPSDSAASSPMHRPLLYTGRPPSASPATGSKTVHDREQAQLIEKAFE